MNSSYVEKLVKKKKTSQIMLIRVITVLIALMIVWVVAFWSVLYGLLVMIASLCAVYYVFANTSVEYEFVLVKNELSVEAIYGKSKRKELYNFDVSKCEIIAPLDSTYAATYQRDSRIKLIDLTSGDGVEPVYILVLPYGGETVKIYMEFNERMLEGMKLAAIGKVKQ